MVNSVEPTRMSLNVAPAATWRPHCSAPLRLDTQAIRVVCIEFTINTIGALRLIAYESTVVHLLSHTLHAFFNEQPLGRLCLSAV